MVKMMTIVLRRFDNGDEGGQLKAELWARGIITHIL